MAAQGREGREEEGEGAWPGCSSREGHGGITRCGGLCCQVLQVQRWVVALGAGLDGAFPALGAGLTRASPVLCTGPNGAFPVLGSGLEGSSPALRARWGRTSPVLAAMLIESFSETPSQSGPSQGSRAGVQAGARQRVSVPEGQRSRAPPTTFSHTVSKRSLGLGTCWLTIPLCLS